jgi:signal transduction histidine kinase
METSQSANCSNDISKQLQNLQNAFLRAMSHEIRTPLNVIVGCCDELSQPDCDPNTRMLLLTQLRRSVRSLIDFCDNASIINMLEAGNVKVRNNQFDLQFTLDFIYCSTKSLVKIHDKNGIITYNFCNKIPNTSVHVIGDDSMICRVLTLLVDNAVKFTDTGTVTLTTDFYQGDNWIDGMHGNCMLVAEVCDTGIGIAPEYHADIFNKFWKVPPTDKIYDGVGLGLTIVNDIIKILGGSITVNSSLGKGASFTVRIPLEMC